jgi:hypothetical protein
MPTRKRPKPPAGGIKADYPGFIAPTLATSITKAREHWIHEIKFDGYRVQVPFESLVHLSDDLGFDFSDQLPDLLNGPRCKYGRDPFKGRLVVNLWGESPHSGLCPDRIKRRGSLHTSTAWPSTRRLAFSVASGRMITSEPRLGDQRSFESRGGKPCM